MGEAQRRESGGELAPPEERVARLITEAARLHAGQNYDAARMHWLAALRIFPENSGILMSLAGSLYALGRFETSASVARRAINADPNNAHAYANLGIALTALSDPSAERFMRKAIEILPTLGSFHYNLGNCHYREGDFAEAIGSFEDAIRLGCDTVDLRNDLALARLAQGDIHRGLEGYGGRWKTFFQDLTQGLGLPVLDNLESAWGKHVLVAHEQGFGDGIMLCRFIQQLQTAVERVSLATRKELVRLYRVNFPDLSVVDWEDDEALRDLKADLRCPMLDLLKVLNVEPSTISSAPYLKVREKFPIDLPRGIKIGLCWASGDHGPFLALRRRYAPLEAFLPLTEIPGVKVLSLQKGPGESDISTFCMNDIVYDYMSRCDDFYDTALLISELDLVVTVDSAVAHLAGALGKPVLMLGPFTRCWRWWGESSGLPWYQNFQIFRQDRDGSWQFAIDSVVAFIHTRICQTPKTTPKAV